MKLPVIASASSELLHELEGMLIVSCQAPENHPMRDTETIARVARSALLGGAAALRINSPEDIRAIRAFTDLPIIGLYKEAGTRREVITIREDQAVELAAAGANIVAVDATAEVTDDIPSTLRLTALACGVPIMADVSNVNEGLQAWDVGVSFVGTTLSGYTPYTIRNDELPDLKLVEDLASQGVRVIAEGRYSTPEEVRQAFDAGAFAVVVGGAITDPMAITKRFVSITPSGRR